MGRLPPEGQMDRLLGAAAATRLVDATWQCRVHRIYGGLAHMHIRRGVRTARRIYQLLRRTRGIHTGAACRNSGSVRP